MDVQRPQMRKYWVLEDTPWSVVCPTSAETVG